MRFEPVNGWVIGRAIIPKIDRGGIILPNESKGVTRTYLVESTSSGATVDGIEIKPGDLIVAVHAYDMIFPDMKRVTFKVSEVITFLRDVSLDSFVDLNGNAVEPVKAAA
jgi:hypothetical protein